ncbi:MAG: hypothetical protein R6W83_08395 [Cryobacterium sp.]
MTIGGQTLQSTPSHRRSAGAPEARPGTVRRRTLRAVIGTIVVAALLGAALMTAVGSLNRSVYSAGGFVEQYLTALARQDAVGALALDGVSPSSAELAAAGRPADLSETLLRASVLGTLTDIEQVSDEQVSPGRHRVVYEFTLGGERDSMEFLVQSTGTFAGVFDRWRFETSPLAVLQVSVLQERLFTVNGLNLDTRVQAAPDAPATFSTQASYLAFAPSEYRLSHDSALLTAEETTVVVSDSGTTEVAVNALPTELFTAKVQRELNSFLDACSIDEVLKPSNCPFGITINDRVLGVPDWSIDEYPDVVLHATTDAFEMDSSTGQARIRVDVQSLFDGELNTRDEAVSFFMGLTATVQPDGNLAIQLR